MTSNKSKLAKWKFIIGFLIFIGLFSAIIVIANRILRDNGLASSYTLILLSAITLYIYYRAWKWTCRKLDRFESDDQSSEA